MKRACMDLPRSGYAHNMRDAQRIQRRLHFPLIIRASRTLGGSGGNFAYGPEDFKEVAAVWTGQALDGSGPLEVVDGPPEGGDYKPMADASDAFIPEYHPEEIYEIAAKLAQRAGAKV